MTTKQMTDYQRSLVVENLKCVDWVLKKRVTFINLPLLDYEELYQVGCEALCNAAMHFIPGKGSFEPYACRVIYNDMLSHFQNAYKHYKAQAVTTPCDGMEDLLEAKLQADVQDYVDAIQERDFLAKLKEIKEMYSGVVKKGVEALELKLLGYKTSEIAQRYGTTVNNVNAWISKARTKLKDDTSFTDLFL